MSATEIWIDCDVCGRIFDGPGLHLEFARVRSKHGANICKRCHKPKDQMDPFHDAATRGDVEVCMGFLKQGVAIDTPDESGRTALHLAAGSLHQGVTELLMLNGANLHARDGHGYTPLHLAAGYDDPNAEARILEMIELLLRNGATANVQTGQGLTPLHLAAAYGQTRVVKRLLAAGADPHIRDNKGYSALAQAEYFGYPEIVEMLERAESS